MQRIVSGRTTPPPGSRKVTDWVGKRVRTRYELRNGLMVIPKGTVCEVTYARSGLSLKTEACGCCGVAVYIKRVPASDVELVPPKRELTTCGECTYEEADGELVEQCPKCKATDERRAA